MIPDQPNLHLVPSTPDTAITARKPLTSIPGFDLYNRPTRKIEYLVDKLIPAGSKFVLSGTRAVWKSWTLTSLACCVAAVEPFMGRFAVTPSETTIGGSVLFVQLEEPIFEAQRKYMWTLAGMGLDRDPRRIQDLLVEYIVGQPFALDHAGRLDEMKRLVEAQKPDLVLWDSLRRAITGKSNDDEFAERLVRMLDELQAIHPSAHGVVAHWRKKSGDAGLNDADERVRGTGAIVDQCDVHLSIERNKIEDFATMSQTKNRMGVEFGAFNYRMQISDGEGHASPCWLGEVSGANATHESGCAAQLLSLLEGDPKRIWKQIQLMREPSLATSFNSEQVRYAVEILERRGKATVDRPGKGQSPLVQLRAPLTGMETEKYGKDVSDLAINTPKPYKDN
jgi:hypothetical protein